MNALVPFGEKNPLFYEKVRELTEEDAVRLLSRQIGAEVGGPPSLKRLRHTHHLLAQALAAGHTAEMASLMTGYTPARVNQLRTDPTFVELMAHYGSVEDQRVVDLGTRLGALGLASVDELQERLERDPDGFSKKELMGLADLALVAKRAAQAAAPQTAPPVFHVVFEGAATPLATINGEVV